MATGSGDVGHGNIKKPGKEVDKSYTEVSFAPVKGQSLEAAGSKKGKQRWEQKKEIYKEK